MLATIGMVVTTAGPTAARKRVIPTGTRKKEIYLQLLLANTAFEKEHIPLYYWFKLVYTGR